ncbi:MAG: hypothetical protein ABIU95_02550, partial [Burkholderiales bacterium]
MLTKSVAEALIACVATLADAPIVLVLPDPIVPKLVASAGVLFPAPPFDFSFASPKKKWTPRTSSNCGPSNDVSMIGSINRLLEEVTCCMPNACPISCISVLRK